MIDLTPTAALAIALSGVGLLAGSFLGLVSLRLPDGRGIVAGRSQCGGCGVALPPWRLIPLVSYAVSRGRCAACRAVIPVRYPLMEAGCAAIGLWASLGQPTPLAALLTALLGWQLLLIAVVDAENFWLPDALTLPLLASGLAAAMLLDAQTLRDAAIGAIVAFVGLKLLALAYRRLRGREGLGGGDPYLLAAGGAWVGWAGLPSVLLWAPVSGLSVVLARQLAGRKVSGDDRLPFGVFLAIGVWLTWLYGPIGLG